MPSQMTELAGLGGFEKIISNPYVWINLTKRVRRYHLTGFPYFILYFKKIATL